MNTDQEMALLACRLEEEPGRQWSGLVVADMIAHVLNGHTAEVTAAKFGLRSGGAR